MLARLPENRSLALGRHGRVRDDQFPMLASAVAFSHEFFCQVRMSGERLDEAFIIGVGIPGTKSEPGFTRGRGKSHRGHPAFGCAVDLLPILARRLNEHEVAL